MPSKKIRIRKMSIKDAGDYAKISWDSELRKYLWPFAAKDTTEAEELLQRELSNMSPTLLAILFRNTLIGAMSVSFYEDEATVSYFIGKNYRKMGYGKASLLVLSEILKHKHPEVKKLSFSVRKTNLASIKLQESLGSVQVKETENHYDYVYRIHW